MATRKIKDPVAAVIANIEKALGNKGDPVIAKFGDKEFEDVSAIPFGIPEVDKASNCGGVPRGKLVEIFGPESGGKSYLSLKLIASAQKQGSNCCLIDAEQSFDPKWAAIHGVDVDNLYLIDKMMSAEKNLIYVDELCKSGVFGVIVVDSTAALIPAKELEGSIEDQDYALLARAMSKGCKKIVANCGASGTICIFINQLREKMGVVFGDNTTTPGGRALKFYAHQRISVFPGGAIKAPIDGEDVVVGKKSYVRFIKNKVATPFGKAEIVITFDAASLNPVTQLAGLGKAEKIFSIRGGEYYVAKAFYNNIKGKSETKNIPTGASSYPELADYMVKNDLVLDVLEFVIDSRAGNEEVMDSVAPISKEVLELKDDPSKIVSPLDNSAFSEEVSEETKEVVSEVSE
jgi:recombination protein RecA